MSSDLAARRAMRFAAIALVIAAVTLDACTPAICSRVSDCASGLVCTTGGLCALPPDAGPTTDATDAAADADITLIGDAAIDAPTDAPNANLGGL